MSKERAFVNLIEQKILSGELKVGEKLSSERALVDQYGYSRKTVHNGLIRLEEKGLIEILERQGAFVKDFHTYGNMSILDTLLNFNKEAFTVREMRHFISFAKVNVNQIIENCVLHNRFDDDEQIIKKLHELLDVTEVDDRTHVVFEIYRLMAVAQENFLLLLLINSLKTGIMNVCFYTAIEDHMYRSLCDLMGQMYEAISIGDTTKAIELNNTIIERMAEQWMKGEDDE